MSSFFLNLTYSITYMKGRILIRESLVYSPNPFLNRELGSPTLPYDIEIGF